MELLKQDGWGHIAPFDWLRTRFDQQTHLDIKCMGAGVQAEAFVVIAQRADLLGKRLGIEPSRLGQGSQGIVLLRIAGTELPGESIYNRLLGCDGFDHTRIEDRIGIAWRATEDSVRVDHLPVPLDFFRFDGMNG